MLQVDARGTHTMFVLIAARQMAFDFTNQKFLVPGT